jgi:3alpha(or 20beta)-hydroxysteroid dehydrogenase
VTSSRVGPLDGRVIVVTGAAQGQGEAEVAALSAQGASVVAADIAPPTAAAPERVHQRHLDVGDPGGWSELAAWIEGRFGHVDGLINNAGITSRVRLGEVALEDWDRILRINATSAMLGIQTLLPLMPRGSSIVNVGSVAALTGHYTAAYTASKAAIRGLTQLAAIELGPRGIRVNAVHPGYIETPMTAGAPAGFRDIMMSLTPLGRPGTPADAAALMVFLMSDSSSFITGAEIALDGGFSIGGVVTAINGHLRGPAAKDDA